MIGHCPGHQSGQRKTSGKTKIASMNGFPLRLLRCGSEMCKKQLDRNTPLSDLLSLIIHMFKKNIQRPDTLDKALNAHDKSESFHSVLVFYLMKSDF